MAATPNHQPPQLNQLPYGADNVYCSSQVYHRPDDSIGGGWGMYHVICSPT